jgi:hypothetical protein
MSPFLKGITSSLPMRGGSLWIRLKSRAVEEICSGMYKVGVDIPAGEYKVLPEENSTLGFGYFEVTKTSRHILDDIVSNDNFEDSRYITLENGQYLKLSEAYIDAGAQ